MITESESLAQPLREEVQEHGALLNLFEEQQTAILRRDPDLVLNLAEAITRQVDLIRSCQRRRKQATRVAATEEGMCGAYPALGVNLSLPRRRSADARGPYGRSESTDSPNSPPGTAKPDVVGTHDRNFAADSSAAESRHNHKDLFVRRSSRNWRLDGRTTVGS